jgi:hypothetical protein
LVLVFCHNNQGRQGCADLLVVTHSERQSMLQRIDQTC